MRRLLAFTKKNFIEVKRSPIYFVFSLIFPILFILLLTIMDKATEDTATGTFINFMKYPSLVPGTMMISCCLPMYFMAAIVSNDRKSALLKRQYISPMRTPEFILGYAIVGFVLGIALLFICYFGGWMIAACFHDDYIPIDRGMLTIVSQIPLLLTLIFFGLLLGCLLNSGAPGTCAIILCFAAILGGSVWGLDGSSEGIQIFTRCLPFYPSVYIGRVASLAHKTYTNDPYVWDSVCNIGLATILSYLVINITLANVLFFIQSKKSPK